MHPLRLNRLIWQETSRSNCIRIALSRFGVKSNTPMVWIMPYGIVVERRSDVTLQKHLPLYDRVELRDYILYRIRRPGTRTLIEAALKTDAFPFKRLLELATRYDPPCRLGSLIAAELRRRAIQKPLLEAERRRAQKRQVARAKRQRILEARAQLYDATQRQVLRDLIDATHDVKRAPIIRE